MTDKVIDGLLGVIKSEKVYYLDKFSEKRDERTLFDLFQKKRRLMYLDYDLHLIKVVEETEKFVVYDLTKKGNDVIDSGGWIKFKQKEKYKQRSKKIKDELKYWAGIFIPFLMLMIALNDSRTNANLEKQNHKLNELQDKQKQEQKDLQNNIQILSKRMDSVLLTLDSKN